MRQEDEAGGPQDTGKAQEPEGSAEKAGSKKDKYQKAQAKAERAAEKLGKAREKLDKVEAKRAAQKPPGLAKKAVRGARTEAWFYLHNKINEVEHENVGVEVALLRSSPPLFSFFWCRAMHPSAVFPVLESFFQTLFRCRCLRSQ